MQPKLFFFVAKSAWNEGQASNTPFVFTFTINIQWEAYFDIYIYNQYAVRGAFQHWNWQSISSERHILTFTFTINIHWKADFHFYIYNWYPMRGTFRYIHSQPLSSGTQRHIWYLHLQPIANERLILIITIHDICHFFSTDNILAVRCLHTESA